MAVALACAMGLGAMPASAADSDFEQRVLAALNAARSRPADMADTLRSYRGMFHGNVVRYPGNKVGLVTQEGVAPVDDAILFLGRQPALAPLALTQGLVDGAADHVADQGPRGLIGHGGTDGSSPLDRVARHGAEQDVAEVIQYGADQPADVVRQLIVDDGIAGRDHRRILFDPELRFAGIACGRHRAYGMMCVIDLARSATRLRSAQADSPTRMALQTPR